MMKLLQEKPTKIQLIAIAVIAALISFGLVYAISSRNNGTARVNSSNCEGTCVALTKDGASPNALAVPVGSYVQFNSADGKAHNLSVGKGGHDHDHTGKFYSGEFQADEGWRVQFTDEGSFAFHDHLNPQINVVVVVYAPGKEYELE